MDSLSEVKGQLQKARLELLDLSTRNRLLNIPRRSKHAKTIEIVDERTNEVFRLLVREGKSMSFVPGRERARAEGEESGLEGSEGLADLPQPNEDEGLDERGVAQRHADLSLQTLMTSEGLQKRLLSLFYDAQTFREEQGVNILYLALGMLRWYESPSSDEARHSPLLLVPVTLERKSAAERFRLRWDQEEPSGNLSLQAKLKAEHGLILPLPSDSEDADLGAYFSAVSAAVASQRRWEVLADDMVLGFFSFSKFLMYRDLDPANWPADAQIDCHPLITALLQEGFRPDGSPIGEDEHLDAHIPPARMAHVVDADSSQTLAIEEAIGGRSMVIQGPPGTGKSQTITNIVAGAVLRGERVLFVAEKMAALEVVKRRLESVGLGPMCLELHSHKANKRTVLDDLRRTFELGRPIGGDDGLLHRLERARDRLNGHSVRMNTRLAPCALTPYEVIGRLVALRQEGGSPPDLPLDGAESWTPEQVRERRRLLEEIADRVRDEGLPVAHPWRGMRLPAVLRMDIDRLLPQVSRTAASCEGLIADAGRLAALVEQPVPTTPAEVARLVSMARRVAAAPDAEPEALASSVWDERPEELEALLQAGSTYAAASGEVAGVVADVAWTTDVTKARLALGAYGRSWLRWLKGDYRAAQGLLRSILTAEPPKTLESRLRLLDQLMAAQKAAAVIARDEVVGRSAFGSAWRREKSDWGALARVRDWLRTLRDERLPDALRLVAARISDKPALSALADEVEARLGVVRSSFAGLAAALDLDLDEAFGESSSETVATARLLQRLRDWEARPDDLSRWISLRVRLEQGRAQGLAAFVERLRDGSLAVDRAVPDFQFAYHESILRMMARGEPDLAAFQGDEHDRLVEEFRTLDRSRIELARLEVASAHHRGIPRADGGMGPLGVLRGEMAKKRGHLPLRRLLKSAGPAVQAMKPVFMMSPLSVAQFLEPGGIQFDLLLIDEASQVMPIDAIGAVARCKRMVVVGDERQLPPTRFFAKMMGEAVGEEDQEDETLSAGDVESILGLCVARGLSQRMLRWHYRSRHQSLIAVSNREFYDNRLFIVPSPYTAEAGMGLRFHHLPHGVFDSGNTAVNAVEALAVAEAVIRHAKETPQLTLGVATFSMKQRQAILDELERLRRLDPETEEFFTAAGHEPFFVKNLENIQGDERDVIMISIGYGRNKSGYMAMRFGPLSAEGGERRLNVLISRAKRRCDVYSSITDEDIDLERGKGRGVAALKVFLQFARTGRINLGQETDRGHDSVFEEQVAKALRQEGYDVRSQIGLAGFFIDLAIADPERPGRYLLGIECDGATYHSSRSARDRDRLRQAVLEDHGWIIHRIWSTDWFQRPEEQLRRAVAAIEAAKAELASRAEHAPARPRAVPIEIVTMERAEGEAESASEPSLSIPYVQASVAVPLEQAPHEVSPARMAQVVRAIIEAEGPIHAAEIVQRVRSLWGLQRAGSRIQAAVLAGLRVASGDGALVQEGDCWMRRGADVPVRDRADAESPTLRKPEMLPPQEIREAIRRLVALHFGGTNEQIATGVSRLLGFKATSAQLRSIIEEQVGVMLASGELSSRDGVLAAGERDVAVAK